MTSTKLIKAPYGYLVEAGFIGYVPDMDRFCLFATENDYLEYIKEGE